MRDAAATPHLNFASDNAGPVHPRIMEALAAANTGHALPYGADPWTASAIEAIRRVFEAPQAEVILVPSGIGANALALSCCVQPESRVFCSQIAHIEVDEQGAVTLASGGAQLELIAHDHGRMKARHLTERLRTMPPAARGALSLTQVTEAGTIYPLDDILALTRIARDHGLPVHMDGARWSNAVVALGCHPGDMTWRAGVDVLSLGGTKAGLMGAEAVVFFDPDLARTAKAQQLRMGLNLSKQRFLGAQLAAWLEGGPQTGLWHALAAEANAAAATLAAGLSTLRGVDLVHPVEANMVFARLPRSMHHDLRRAGAAYMLTDQSAEPQSAEPQSVGSDSEPIGCRLVCDWSTTTDRIDALLSHLRH
ncbi:MAG: beta-eliminating lyase-related protein [Pseudomonadota bacterium]